jgi:hypothetical protein
LGVTATPHKLQRVVASELFAGNSVLSGAHRKRISRADADDFL